MAIILVVVLLVISIASSIISLISALMSEENNSDAGSYITVTLYVQATDMSNKPLKDVVVDLKPTKKNKDGSEIKMPATDKEGIASVMLGTSGGAADAPGQGQTVYLSCSYYNDVGGTHCGPHTQIGVCAADPYIIPHGSVIYVQAVDPKTLKPNGKVYGYAEATDTGGFLTKKYNNKLTSKGQAYNGHKQGVYDEYGGKIYKRAVDLWMPSEQGNHWGTRLCAVTIVKKTNPGCWDSKYCGPGGEKGKEQQGSNLNNLYSYRAGSTILPNGNLSDAVKYGDYVVSCTGGLNSKQGSNSLNVDTLVNGDPQVITVAGGKLKFWVDISESSGDFNQAKKGMSKGTVTINGRTYILYSQASPAGDADLRAHGCCPTSTAIIATGFGYNLTPIGVRKEAGGVYAARSIDNSKKSLTKRGTSVTKASGVSETKIIEYLKSGNPIICRIDGGRSHTVGSHTYTCGHFFTILGYDSSKGIFIADPGTWNSDNNGWYPTSYISKMHLAAWYMIK